MIKATDLRIGNLIYGPSDRIETVVGIEDSGMIKTFAGNFVFGVAVIEISDLSPIPLTEEWLNKLGFEKSSDTSFDLKLRISATALFCRFNKEWYFQLGPIYLGAAFKYVHQVQNFFSRLLCKS